jgi:hypothetical protein
MDQIDAALAHLRAQKKPNYASAARTYGVKPTTLRRRFLGLTRSRALINSEDRQLLNDVQEDTLLGYINRLSDKYIPPTTQIIKNLAEGILSKPVEKNWSAGFIRRYKNRIYSIYLRPLNHARTLSENTAVFKHFYYLVLLFLC